MLNKKLNKIYSGFKFGKIGCGAEARDQYIKEGVRGFHFGYDRAHKGARGIRGCFR